MHTVAAEHCTHILYHQPIPDQKPTVPSKKISSNACSRVPVLSFFVRVLLNSPGEANSISSPIEQVSWSSGMILA
jgi:hypothetical protein